MTLLGVGAALPFYRRTPVAGGGGGGGGFNILLESGDALDAENGDNLRQE